MGTFRIGLVAACVVALSLSACTSGFESADGDRGSRSAGKFDANGSPGVWELARGQRLNNSSSTFIAIVTRLDCNGGVTGKVAKPVVQFAKSQIIVTFHVTPKNDGIANCESNELVPYKVELDEPLKGRTLKDGQCLSGGPAVGTTLCGSSRWSPADHAVAHHLSAPTFRVLNHNGLTTTLVNGGTKPKISEHSVLARGTPRQRALVTEIALVRITNANSGRIDSAGVVHPSMQERLVWLVIARDPYPFESGPVDKPRTVQTTPSYTSYLWNAIDAQTGRFLQAETFSSTP